MMINKFSPQKPRGDSPPQNIAKYSIFDEADMPSPVPKYADIGTPSPIKVYEADDDEGRES